MSWQASRWARDQATGSATAKAVLFVIAEQVSTIEATCCISTAMIAARAELGRTAVLRGLATLERAGLISRNRRINPASGHRMSDEIRLPVRAIGQGAASEPSGAKVREADLGPRSASEGAKVRLTGGQGPPDGPHIDKGLGEGLGEVAPSPSRAKQAVPIQEGFPDKEEIERERAYLQGQGWNIDPAFEAQKFRAHAEAHDRRMKNWGAAFHQWILKSTEFAPASAKVAPIKAADAPSAPEPWRARLAAFCDQANRYWNPTDWGPPPGKAGCEVPAAYLAEFGFGPENVHPFSQRGAA